MKRNYSAVIPERASGLCASRRPERSEIEGWRRSNLSLAQGDCFGQRTRTPSQWRWL